MCCLDAAEEETETASRRSPQPRPVCEEGSELRLGGWVPGGAAGRKAKGRQQGCAASGTPSGGPSQATARPAPGHSDSRLQSSLPASPPTDTALSWPTLTSLLPRALEEVTWSRTWPVTSRRDPGTCSASPSPGTLPWKGDGTTVLTPWNEGRARCGHARKPSSAAPGAREEQHLAAAVALVPGVRGHGQGAQSVPPQPGAVGTLEHVAPAPRRPVPPQAEPISPPPPAPPPASGAAFSEVSSRPAVPPNFGAPTGLLSPVFLLPLPPPLQDTFVGFWGGLAASSTPLMQLPPGIPAPLSPRLTWARPPRPVSCAPRHGQHPPHGRGPRDGVSGIVLGKPVSDLNISAQSDATQFLVLAVTRSMAGAGGGRECRFNKGHHCPEPGEPPEASGVKRGIGTR